MALLDFLGLRAIYTINRVYSTRFAADRYHLYDDVLVFISQANQGLSNGISLSWNVFGHIETLADYFTNAVLPLIGNAAEHAFNPTHDELHRMDQTGFSKLISLFSVGPDNASDGEYLLSVRDNGFGIRQDILEHLFEEGMTEKTDNETRHGVGLFEVKRFVEKYGGRIWAESIPGKGTTFSFTIPCTTPNGEWYYQRLPGTMPT